jgi:hypothetical protein
MNSLFCFFRYVMGSHPWICPLPITMSIFVLACCS